MPKAKLRVVFMGCPDFAVPSLKALANDDKFEIAAVYCMPDRPKGRGKKPAPTPIKIFAAEKGFRVETPASFRKDPNAVEILQSFAPDYLVVVAYGLILPESVLAIPRIAPVNLHASILPAYRGPAPIHYALINGDSETGNTVMLMSKGMDEGDILSLETTQIYESDNLQTLHDRLSATGAIQLKQTLIDLADGKITPQPQNHEKANYTAKITPETSRIDWSKSASEIANLIRAMNPFPGAWFAVENERFKIFKANAISENHNCIPGKVLLHNLNDGLRIACGNSSILEVLELQKSGKARMPVRDFLRGCKLGTELLA